MVLDYHDKRTTQRVSERKPVQKNRPKRQSYGAFLVVGVAALALSFGAGLLTGRVLYKNPKIPPIPAPAQPAPKKGDAAAVPAKEQVTEPSLTFYQTLPAGTRGAIGSGINTNLKHQEAPPPPKPAAPAAPAASAEPDVAAKPAEGQGRFVVQIASYRDKAEADAAQAKLAERGVAAYVTESRTADKGVWYRLRVGKHLSKEDAEGLSAKAGKGAVVLPE